MSVMEKLVDIIQNSVGGCARHWAEIIADGLIAHGVTFKDVPDTNVGEWISVKDRLPDSSGYYLTYRGGYCYVLSYSTKHKLFNIYDEDDSEWAKRYHIAVPHWMPLPQPPKGEPQCE